MNEPLAVSRPSQRQTLEQQRAAYALACVGRYRSSPSERTARYHTLVGSSPAMILQNGLGQTLAFWLADGPNKPARELYDHLQGWLCGPLAEDRPERVYAGGDLIEALMAGSREEYQRAQQTALALLVWLKRFADAYLEEAK